MRRFFTKIILGIAAIFMSSCAVLDVVKSATQTKEEKQQILQSRYEIERTKHVTFYCLMTKEIGWHVSDNSVTVQQITEHNEKWRKLCLDNQPESQLNNLGLAAINRG